MIAVSYRLLGNSTCQPCTHLLADQPKLNTAFLLQQGNTHLSKAEASHRNLTQTLCQKALLVGEEFGVRTLNASSQSVTLGTHHTMEE